MFEKMYQILGDIPKPISNDEYRSRQEHLFSSFEDSDVLILCSSPETIHSNDVHHPYRTQSNLLYLSGWLEPESILCATYDGSNWSSLMNPEKSDGSIAWSQRSSMLTLVFDNYLWVIGGYKGETSEKVLGDVWKYSK